MPTCSLTTCTADNGKLRAEVETTLQTLGRTRRADAGRRRVSTADARGIANGIGSSVTGRRSSAADDATLQIKREQLLYAKVEGVVRGIKLTQGAAKEPRQVAISREASIAGSRRRLSADVASGRLVCR